jgi:uncharacterized membrane protein
MKAELFALLSSVSIGFNTVIIKKGIERTNPIAAMFMLTAVSTVIFWGLSLATISMSFFRSKAVLYFLFSGIFSPALVRWLYFVSLDRLGPSVSSSVLATGPAFATIFAVSFLNERLTLLMSLGIFCIILGIVIFERDTMENEKVPLRKREDLIFPLSAAVLYAFAIGLRKMGLNILNSPIFGVTVGFTTSLIAYSTIFVFSKRSRQYLSFKRNDLFMFGAAGISLAAAWLFLFYALSFGDVITVAPLASLHPLVVVGLSYFFLKEIERITPKIVLGVLIVVVGVALITT